MSTNIPALDRLITNLAKLPGVGRKTATRLAIHILRGKQDYASDLSEALLRLKAEVRLCNDCFYFCEGDRCTICESGLRRKDLLCVVEEPSDVMVLESHGSYDGRYHVLHGHLSPVDGIGPDKIRIGELEERMGSGEIREVILALGASLEGDATSLYIKNLLKDTDVKVTRIAHGIPIGMNIEFIDERTLARALENRREM